MAEKYIPYNGSASPGDFQDGAIIDSSHFTNEFDQLGLVFDGSTGHNHDGQAGSGPKIDTSGLALNAVDSTILDETDSSYVVAGMTINSLTVTSGTAVTSIDTDLSSVSATDNSLASAKAIKAYVDTQVTASDLDFQGDSGGALSIDLDSETLTIAGGTGLTTTGSGNTLTVDIDSTVATLTGTQTLTNKTLTSPDINTPDIDGGTIDGTAIGGTTAAAGSFTTVSTTGNITVGGTVAGRDVATDGTKLDGIEAGATADQTAAEIKTAYESNADTNAFTDAEQTKLSGIEAGADVTDSTNVTAAGALMDSEVTNLAQVKAFDSSDYATAAQGTTADSALQPADNISELTNDSGYITGNQTITLSGDATGSGTTSITVALAANTVGVSELNLSDGTAGQFLKTDGAGNISFATAPTQQTSFTTLDVDNINLDGNTISSTDTDGNLRISPNGTGAVEFYKASAQVSDTEFFRDQTFNTGFTYVIAEQNYYGKDNAGVKTNFAQIDVRGDGETASSGSLYIGVAQQGTGPRPAAGGTGFEFSGTSDRISVYGDLRLMTSHDLIMSSGGGIDFSYTADASGMTDELLDDYEEGTWTPNLSTASGTFSTMNITGVTCSYVKIGKQVTLQGAFNTSDVSIGTALGGLRLTGIPFVPANDHARGACYGALFAGERPTQVSTDNANHLEFWYSSSVTSNPSLLQASDLMTGASTNNIFRFTITYEV